MSACIKKITQSFIRDCSYRPKAGIKNTVYLVNTEDIDRTSELSSTKQTVTNLVLNTDGFLYPMEGAGKYPQGKSEVSIGDNGFGWKHTLSVRILYYGADERDQLQQMLNGGRFTAIIEKKDTGMSGELTYEILGWESGMAISSVSWESNANDGVVSVEFATAEGEEEGFDRRIFLENDTTNVSDLDTTIATIEKYTYSSTTSSSSSSSSTTTTTTTTTTAS